MYGIVCDSRKGRAIGIRELALVDRARSTRLWWTSDNANIAICYEKKSAAEFAAGRLKKNNARVVPFVRVQEMLRQQYDRIAASERNQREAETRDYGEGPGWDAHKFC